MIDIARKPLKTPKIAVHGHHRIKFTNDFNEKFW